METYEIRPLGDGIRYILSGPLGMIERIELETIREAAIHAQSCAMGTAAVLRLFNADGTLKNERPIPPRRRGLVNSRTYVPWF